MPQPTKEEKMKALIEFVDVFFKQRRTRDVFRVFLPAIFILGMLIFIVFLMVYQWTNISILNWTPGLVSIVAIAIAFSSYVQSSVKSVNKTVAYSIARRLISLYPDKDEETFYLLSSLVALKEDNYPIKLSTLYKIDKNIFEPKKLLEYFYLK